MDVPYLAWSVNFNWGGLACVGVAVALVMIAIAGPRGSRRCPGCREINRQAAIFCAQCGRKLPGR